MRNTIISLYQPSHLANLIPTMQSLIEAALLDLETGPGGEITFSDVSLKLATDVIGQAAFGVDLGLSKGDHRRAAAAAAAPAPDDQVSAFVKLHVYSTTSLKMDLSGSFSIVLGLLAPILQEPFRQVLKRVPGTADWKMERINGELSRRMDAIVARRARERVELQCRDFLSAILKARESGGAAGEELFSPDYVSALTYEHLLAGSATTSFTLSSVLYLVAGHPPVERRLLEEIDAFGPNGVVPSADDLHLKFPYLDQAAFPDSPSCSQGLGFPRPSETSPPAPVAGDQGGHAVLHSVPAGGEGGLPAGGDRRLPPPQGKSRYSRRSSSSPGSLSLNLNRLRRRAPGYGWRWGCWRRIPITSPSPMSSGRRGSIPLARRRSAATRTPTSHSALARGRALGRGSLCRRSSSHSSSSTGGTSSAGPPPWSPLWPSSMGSSSVSSTG